MFDLVADVEHADRKLRAGNAYEISGRALRLIFLTADRSRPTGAKVAGAILGSPQSLLARIYRRMRRRRRS